MDRDTISEVCPKPPLPRDMNVPRVSHPPPEETGVFESKVADVPCSAQVEKPVKKDENQSKMSNDVIGPIEQQVSKTSSSDAKKASAEQTEIIHLIIQGVFIELWIVSWEVTEELFNLFNDAKQPKP